MAILYFHLMKKAKSKKLVHRINYSSRTNKKIVDEIFSLFQNPYSGMQAAISRDHDIPAKPYQTGSTNTKRTQNGDLI